MTRDELRKDQTAQYLGDGVYATHDGRMVSLWTTDGIMILNEIHLEPEVYEALERFRAQMVGD